MVDLNWPKAYRDLGLKADFKTFPQDFVVIETLSFELTGEGEHLYLYVEKVGQNTAWVARQLADWANISVKDVSYAGLKDRHAVTQQWFSLWLPGKSDPELPLELEGVKILSSIRHQAKLQRGALKTNHFEICLRKIETQKDNQPICSEQMDQIDHRLKTIASQGVPNYFGDQRFGRDGGNVAEALKSLSNRRLKRDKKSILTSSLRSFLFNHLLAHRINNDTWLCPQTGEPMMLEGSRSWFIAGADEDLGPRLKEWDCHPSGMLWGDLNSKDKEQPYLIAEREFLSGWPKITEALDRQRLKAARRSLRMRPDNLVWRWQDRDLIVEFDLPAGQYATTFLDELIELHENIIE